MTKIGISMGWNCGPAQIGVDKKIRGTKSEGYETCPFDEMITNLPGIIECIRDDFKDFMNEEHLSLIRSPENVGGIVKGETLVYNTKYNFIFNHESPGHANLFVTQSWSGGINHYVDNNYSLLKERYNRRVDSFRKYIKQAQEGHEINFILSRFNKNVDGFHKVLIEKYPNLKYEILSLNPKETSELVYGHHILMGLNEDIVKNELNQI